MLAHAVDARSPAPPDPSPEPPGPPGAEPRAEPALCPLLELFSRVQQDEEQAFCELHGQTQRLLTAVVLGVLRSADLTEDVVQEAYLHIWRQRHRFQADRGSVLGWMTTIAHRRAVDRVRSLTRARDLETRYVVGTGALAADPDHQTHVVDAVDAAARLSGALAALTQVQREALLLSYWEGRTAKEAAQMLGIPVPTVKSRIHSATTRLRALVDDPIRPVLT